MLLTMRVWCAADRQTLYADCKQTGLRSKQPEQGDSRIRAAALKFMASRATADRACGTSAGWYTMLPNAQDTIPTGVYHRIALVVNMELYLKAHITQLS
jgi:hypothetical protein